MKKKKKEKTGLFKEAILNIDDDNVIQLLVNSVTIRKTKTFLVKKTKSNKHITYFHSNTGVLS